MGWTVLSWVNIVNAWVLKAFAREDLWSLSPGLHYSPREPLFSITGLLPPSGLLPACLLVSSAGHCLWQGPGSCKPEAELAHLLIVSDLIVQDDAIGLLRLWPWQGDAPHGGADLVHDGNSGRGCGERKRQGIETDLQLHEKCHLSEIRRERNVIRFETCPFLLIS